jgi:hypothetical protein
MPPRVRRENMVRIWGMCCKSISGVKARTHSQSIDMDNIVRRISSSKLLSTRSGRHTTARLVGMDEEDVSADNLLYLLSTVCLLSTIIRKDFWVCPAAPPPFVYFHPVPCPLSGSLASWGSPSPGSLSPSPSSSPVAPRLLHVPFMWQMENS